jgi:hypothetical protein
VHRASSEHLLCTYHWVELSGRGMNPDRLGIMGRTAGSPRRPVHTWVYTASLKTSLPRGHTWIYLVVRLVIRRSRQILRLPSTTGTASDLLPARSGRAGEERRNRQALPASCLALTPVVFPIVLSSFSTRSFTIGMRSSHRWHSTSGCEGVEVVSGTCSGCFFEGSLRL